MGIERLSKGDQVALTAKYRRQFRKVPKRISGKVAGFSAYPGCVIVKMDGTNYTSVLHHTFLRRVSR